MTPRYIRKVLAGFQDIVFGQGTVAQTRAGEEVAVAKVNSSHIPYTGDTETGDLVSVKDKLDQISTILGI